MLRDASDYIEASYEEDPAMNCDTIEDHIRELVAKRTKPDERLVKFIAAIVGELLKENRLASLVDVNRLTSKETLARLMGEVIDAPQPRLMACCIDFVFNLGVQLAKNETAIAEGHGVTKASVSRYCVHLKNVFLQGVPVPGMKSAEAVENYRTIRTGKTSAPKAEWAFSNEVKTAFKSAS
jgi:hypothetical protein